MADAKRESDCKDSQSIVNVSNIGLYTVEVSFLRYLILYLESNAPQ